MKEAPGQTPPSPGPSLTSTPRRGSISHGIPFALSLTTPHPSLSLGMSSAGQPLGVERRPGQRASVTGLPPARGHWAESHPAAGHGMVIGANPYLVGTPQELAHRLPAGTWGEQA